MASILGAGVAGGSLSAIVAAFLFGVFVGFTPCVYPVLPITVAYIGSIARGSKLNGFFYSLVYVFGMALVYATIGVITARLGGQIGTIWNDGWVLLALANFFILLGLVQLHAFAMPLPRIILLYLAGICVIKSAVDLIGAIVRGETFLASSALGAGGAVLFLAVFLVIFMYAVFHVFWRSGIVRMRPVKATVVFLISAAAAYCLALVSTTGIYSFVGAARVVPSVHSPQRANVPLMVITAGLTILITFVVLWRMGALPLRSPQFALGGGARRRGIVGALAVGAASGLVVGPCTLPGLAAVVTLIGSNAQKGSAGSLISGAVVMFAYSLGLGSLIVICGTFSGFLANLPKSGPWLSGIEKAFAILLILAAEFFLIYLGQNAKFPLLSSLTVPVEP